MTLKWWIVSLCVWYALLAGVFLVATARPSTPPRPQTDWEMVAACLWERWDQTESMEETARKIRFCVEVEPHSLP